MLLPGYLQVAIWHSTWRDAGFAVRTRPLTSCREPVLDLILGLTKLVSADQVFPRAHMNPRCPGTFDYASIADLRFAFLGAISATGFSSDPPP